MGFEITFGTDNLTMPSSRHGAASALPYRDWIGLVIYADRACFLCVYGSPADFNDSDQRFRRSGIDTHQPNVYDQAVMTACYRIKQKDTKMSSV
ncbi:hypothetical protein BV898_09913 [Hypsibius exemplaris]|uniref:Uncharacterized protein n=1 Tax=Hypsibius exemplaris TaxID=2072580 RepID=A0A1W0WLJ4_HYPEX|nr:hypothetical protein BV898_09913 [Hypsibius exemplaris]